MHLWGGFMEKFNYGKYFDEHNIFKIENKEEISKMKIAVEDANMIEKYFFRIVPNVEQIRKMIAFSFRLNKDLSRIDRVNYIRGLVYCEDYIDLDDIKSFYNLLTDYTYVVDVPSIFAEKSYELIDGEDFFENVMAIENLKNRIKPPIYQDGEIEIEMNIDEEDEESIETARSMIEKIINFSERNTSIIKEETNDDTSEEEKNYEDIEYIDISPKEKIELFKQNFEKYIEIVFKNKNIDLEKNDKAAIMIKLGMKDWFNYIIEIIETIYTITEAEKDCMYKKLSYFV